MIRPALPSDLAEILEVFQKARAFMKANGNPTQWGDSYPPDDQIAQDIQSGVCYVCEEEGRIQAVFSFLPGEDPCYATIEGAWLNDAPYCAVHRVASRGEKRGMTAQILAWALARCGNVRIDTHADNIPMQRALSRAGFTRCGIIRFTDDGTPRIAYQKSRRTGQSEKGVWENEPD